MKKPIVLSSDVVHQNAWYGVRHDRVRWGKDEESDYFVVEPRGNGSVMIVAVDAGRILVVEQYRFPTDTIEQELCAGMLEEGEDAVPGAARELQEEAGLRAENMCMIGKLHLSASLSSWGIYVIAASNFSTIAPIMREASERSLRAKWVALEEWTRAIRNNTVTDPLSIAAWKLYQENVLIDSLTATSSS